MEQRAMNIHINIHPVEGGSNLYHCAMNVNGDPAPVEANVEFPFGTVELLQPIYQNTLTWVNSGNDLLVEPAVLVRESDMLYDRIVSLIYQSQNTQRRKYESND